MKILILGDIVAKSGRNTVTKHLARVVAENDVDFVVANVDNVAHGTGMTETHAKDFLKQGIHVMTGGNHIVDKQEIFPFLQDSDRLLRPINYNEKIPGRGYGVYQLDDGRRILVIHAMGQVFMPQLLDNPFPMIDKVLASYKLGKNVDAIVVDFHADATSEKYAMGHFLDGRVSCIVGTHTHIPTADAHIMEKGSGFMCDIGMNGDYDSIIGTDKRVTLENFLCQFRYRRMEQVDGEGTFSAFLIETNQTTGLAKMVKHIKIGGILEKWKV